VSAEGSCELQKVRQQQQCEVMLPISRPCVRLNCED
jgi:hypothetical protein